MKRWTGKPWRRLGLLPRAGWLVVGGYSAAAVLIAGASVFGSVRGWRGPDATWPLDEVVKVLCLVFATACSGYSARRAVGRRRFGWLALFTGLLGWAVGEVIRTVYDVRPAVEHAAHPGVADALVFVYPVDVLASLVLLSEPNRRILRRDVLDG